APLPPLVLPDGVTPRTRREARALAQQTVVPEPPVDFAPVAPTFTRPALATADAPPPQQQPTPEPRPRRRWWVPLVKLVAVVTIAMLLTVAVKAFAFRTFTVTSESMEPALIAGDSLLIEMV